MALALSGLSLYGRPNGSAVWIQSVRDFYYLARTGAGVAASVDGITIVLAKDGASRWIRRCKPDRYWQLFTAWYYDAAAGNDENAGSIGAPIKTIGELLRRVGKDSGGVVTDVTLNIAAALSDPEATLMTELTSGLRQWTVA